MRAVSRKLLPGPPLRRAVRRRPWVIEASVRAPCDPREWRVLAFEDTYDIKRMLEDGDVKVGVFAQHWDTSDAVRCKISHICAPDLMRIYIYF